LIPIIVIHHNGSIQRGFGSGWKIILPSNWGMAFWISFIYAGARAIGQREHYALCTEQGLPHFPQDYPDTLAYQNYSNLLYQKLLEEYNKKPPAKRVNFLKLNVQNPFRCSWESLLNLETKEKESIHNKFCVIRGYYSEFLKLEYSPSVKTKINGPKMTWNIKSNNNSSSPNFEIESLNNLFFENKCLIRVSIRTFNRTPLQFAMICFPTQTDYSEWFYNSKLWKKPTEPINKKKKNQRNNKRNYWIYYIRWIFLY
jgi:ribonuclease P/MRP protein subunit POP1